MFAYIPSSVVPKLSKLAASDYADNHNYYVDGRMITFPAYIDGAWKSVLVGSPGAGGRAVFALDVSTPASFDAADVLWEVSDDPDIGYMLGQHAVVRLSDGKWYAAVANGYYSDNKTAMLLLIDLSNGSITKIPTNNGSAANPNGLSPVSAVDIDGDQVVDLIYAGDYRGNLWRFDVRNMASLSADKLFTGTASNGNEQHITTRPELGAHHDGGVMVYFGTGKYFEKTDGTLPATPDVQTFYGIRDNLNVIDSNDSVNLNNDRSDLQPQYLTNEEQAERPVRLVSTNSVNYTNKRGWYLDLNVVGEAADGERVITAAHLRKGRIEFSTITPESVSKCTSGGRSWIYSLDGQTGANPAQAIFDINNDHIIDNTDDVDIDGTDRSISVVGYDGLMGEISHSTRPENDFITAPVDNGTVSALAAKGGYKQGRVSWRRIR
jgi:type IV pilus assembly protein PilY1